MYRQFLDLHEASSVPNWEKSGLASRFNPNVAFLACNPMPRSLYISTYLANSINTQPENALTLPSPSIVSNSPISSPPTHICHASYNSHP